MSGPSCALCGCSADTGAETGADTDPVISADGVPPLGWSSESVETPAGRRTSHTCPACTRRVVRSIEAKLDQAWW